MITWSVRDKMEFTNKDLTPGNRSWQRRCLDPMFSTYYPFSERNDITEHSILKLFEEHEEVYQNNTSIQNYLLQNMVHFVKKMEPELLQVYEDNMSFFLSYLWTHLSLDTHLLT